MAQAKIFISHAVGDATLAKALVKFLMEAIGVPKKEIFCSSLPDHDVPLAEDFNVYIKNQIQEPKLVIALMTETYLERYFCLMELGAAWAISLKTLPIVVPPVSFATVTSTLGLKQAWEITNHKGLTALRTLVKSVIDDLEERGDNLWDDKRTDWQAALPGILKGLPKATSVPRSEHETVLAKSKELEESAADLERQLTRAGERIAALSALKDREQVKAVDKDFGEGDAEETFSELIDAVRDAKPDKIADVVFLHLILDRYNKAGTIAEEEYDAFERAAQYNIIVDNDVNWNSSKLTPLKKALAAVERFLKTEEGQSVEDDHPDWPMDADDREFWEYHLHL